VQTESSAFSVVEMVTSRLSAGSIRSFRSVLKKKALALRVRVLQRRERRQGALSIQDQLWHLIYKRKFAITTAK
jgi:environmental stress-induced protein Ves